jgi:hypothetical protein
METEIAAIERLGITPEQAREQGGSSWILAQAEAENQEQGQEANGQPVTSNGQ